ncbi:hypothetical protein MVEN_00430600 [Mycena venus]|uniref:Uncharacterized protein n=1 Tax=Mycena venus TaxID=2733690 RepID=A0A8H6YVB7_9AGAR|nr:hypothetical protein MVEN_00430600 [Mycena venus]
MDDAPPHLLISALTWTGWPTTWSAGDGSEHIGTYREAATGRLNRLGIDAGLGAVEYAPVTELVFQYTRRAFAGTASSEIAYYGKIMGDNIPPLVRICLPDRLPWPERFRRSRGIRRSLSGPPFEFYDEDWKGETGLDPDRLRGLAFSPDLPGQLVDDADPDGDAGHEQDSWVGLGWHGAYATALLERQSRGEPLGERTEIVWDSRDDAHATWGVQVHLQALKVTEVDAYVYTEVENPPDARGISSYDIRARVLRVFVREGEFVRLRQPDKAPEEDLADESDFSEMDGDEDMEYYGDEDMEYYSDEDMEYYSDEDMEYYSDEDMDYCV